MKEREICAEIGRSGRLTGKLQHVLCAQYVEGHPKCRKPCAQQSQIRVKADLEVMWKAFTELSNRSVRADDDCTDRADLMWF